MERRTMDVQIRHEPERSRFIAEAEGTKSYVRYVLDGDELDLTSTFVDPTVRGRHVGEKLVKAALEYAQGNGYRVIPTCWFVETVVRRHKQFQPLLTGG
jgi:predicted GNAT family acetyltransferase